jgi:hypothetical protein
VTASRENGPIGIISESNSRIKSYAIAEPVNQVEPSTKLPRVVTYSSHNEYHFATESDWKNLPTNDLLTHYSHTRKMIIEGQGGLVSNMIDLDFEIAMREVDIPPIPTSLYYQGQWSLGLSNETPDGSYHHFSSLSKAQLNEIYEREPKKKPKTLQWELKLDNGEEPMRQLISDSIAIKSYV